MAGKERPNLPKLKERFKKGLSIGSALGVVLSGVFLSPLSIDPPAVFASQECDPGVTVPAGGEVTLERDGDDCLDGGQGGSGIVVLSNEIAVASVSI